MGAQTDIPASKSIWIRLWLSLLKRTSTILWSISLNFRQSKNTIFKGFVTVDNEIAPLELEIFFQWLLVGTKDLNRTTNDQVKCLARSISQCILYNMKPERQAQYIPKTNSYAPRKSYQTAQQIGLALALKNSDRNNQVLNQLSAPGYGITISTKQTLLWETHIANAEIKRMVSNGFPPFNLKKNVIQMFHLDNIDWLEDTPDGKNTSHLLSQSYLT